MHKIKDKDLPITLFISLILWVLILNTVGWGYTIYSLVVVGASFVAGFFVYRYLTINWASCATFILILSVVGAYETTPAFWARALPTFLVGLLPGARIGFFARERKNLKDLAGNDV